MRHRMTWLLLLVCLAGCKQPDSRSATAPAAEAAKSDSTPTATATPPPAAPAPTPAPQPVVIPAGTILEARISQALSTARNRAGDPFTASLERPVDIGGREVLPRGATMRGHVTTSRSSGRMEGRAVIGITLDSVEVNGQDLPIVTSLDTQTSAAHKKRNLEMIGGGSGVGALIGVLAGGGKGAAIGALAGAGAGAAGAAATGKKDVEIPAETVFTFRLKSSLTLP